MSSHPIRQIIEWCDQAVSARDFDSLMQYYTEDAGMPDGEMAPTGPGET